MSSGMKWLAMVLIGGMLVTAWARTISSPEAAVRAQPRDELRRSMQTNMTALRSADGAYREFARADSLLPLLPAEAGVVVALSPAVPQPKRDTIGAVLATELAALGELRARIGVFLVDHAYGSRVGIPRTGTVEERELYVGTDEAGPYCAMVATGFIADGVMRIDGFTARRGAARDPAVARSVLGPCAFIGRYGAPGAHISQWLRDHAYSMADGTSRSLPGQFREPAQHRRELVLWTRGDLRMRGCIGGREDLCREIVLAAARNQAALPGAATFNLGRAFVYPDAAYPTMLSDIEESFGRERFARFWTSDQDVETAFAGAFGVSIGAWVREWGQTAYGAERLGPAVGTLSVLLSALIGLAFAGAASFVAARRRI